MLLVWSLLLLACLQEIAHAHVSKTHSALTVPSAETKGKAAKRGRILIPKEHSYWPRNPHASKTIDESSVHLKFHYCCLAYIFTIGTELLT